MSSAARTLVKSQPELWELISQPERMEGWSSALLGRAASVELSESDPENRLAWEASADREAASVEIELEQDGWGTNVAIIVRREGADTTRLDGWLDAVLDELSEPEKRPFRNLV
jgi:hypothetical protein